MSSSDSDSQTASTNPSTTAPSIGPSSTSPSTSAHPQPAQDGPVPLSMPSILVNPRLRHLQSTSSASKSDQRDSRDARSIKKEKEMGKRRKRRYDNARFVSNPHIARPSMKDYSLSHPNPIRNPDVASNLSIPYGFPPTGQAPSYEASSAHSGQFTLGLKEAHSILREKIGVDIETSKIRNAVNGRDRSRRDSSGTRLRTLEKSSGRLSLENQGKGKAKAKDVGPAQRLVLIAEKELRDWLSVSVYLPSEDQDESKAENRASFREIVSSEFEEMTSEGASKHTTNQQEVPQLAEISRYPHSLVWILPDPFLRLAIHCLARTLGCPSFSKDPPRKKSSEGISKSPIDSIRQTFILNPNPLAREPKSNRRGRDRTTRRTRSTSTSSISSDASSININITNRPPITSAIRNAMDSSSLVTPPTTDVGTDLENNGSIVWESQDETNLDSSDSDKDSEIKSQAGLSDVGESNEDQSESEEAGDVTLKGKQKNISEISMRLQRAHINSGATASASSPLARNNHPVEQDYDEEAEADLDSDSDVNSRLGDSIESLP